MKQYVEDIKRLFGILKPSLESASIREDFGQIVVCLESRTFDGLATTQLEKMVGHLCGEGASMRVDAGARRVYYLPPDHSSSGFLDYKSFVGELKSQGMRLAVAK